jgi:hypothetical protein
MASTDPAEVRDVSCRDRVLVEHRGDSPSAVDARQLDLPSMVNVSAAFLPWADAANPPAVSDEISVLVLEMYGVDVAEAAPPDTATAMSPSTSLNG